MSTPDLGPLARQLLERLTAPAPDHVAFVGPQEPPDVALLTRDELGAIWGAVDRAYYGGREIAEAPAEAQPPDPWKRNKPAYDLAVAIRVEVQEHQHWPRLDEAQALDYLRRSEGQRRSWQRALEALACRADPQAPVGAEMAAELRRILGPVEEIPWLDQIWGSRMVGQMPHEALLIARCLEAGGGGPVVDALADLMRERCPPGRYARQGLEILLGLSREELAAQCWPRVDFDFLRDARYRAFDEEVLRDAEGHLQAIHRGEAPYVGYKAFSDYDVSALFHAWDRAARRNEPWLDGLAHAILTLATMAPDRKSKSLPSQTLTCNLAWQFSLLPTPARIDMLKEAAGLAINATVKRTLELRLKQAKTNLALRPEVVLAMAASGPPDRKQQTLLARLLQASYASGLDFSPAEWRQQLCLSPGASAFTQSLIWRAQPADGGAARSFVAQVADGTVALRDNAGQRVEIAETARIQLWHPLHATGEEREAWRAWLRQQQVRQPFPQAWRECYEPWPDELERPEDADALWASNRTDRFAHFRVDIHPMIGLARAEGWKIDEEGGFARNFGDVVASFDLADEVHPGMDGQSDSGALCFWRSQGEARRRVPVRSVPPVIFSEACRAVDLLVSTCSYAYTGDDPSSATTVGEAGIVLFGDPTPPQGGSAHPGLRRERRLRQLGKFSIADMAANRRQVLMQVFAAPLAEGRIRFQQRSAQVGDHAVNLATAQVSRAGERIEFKVPKPGTKGSKLAALPWVPYDEALLEKLVGTIAALL